MRIPKSGSIGSNSVVRWSKPGQNQIVRGFYPGSLWDLVSQ